MKQIKNLLELMKIRESVNLEQKDFFITDIVYKSKSIECIYENSTIDSFELNEDEKNYELKIINANSWNGGSALEVIIYFSQEEVLKEFECYKTDDECGTSYIYKLELKEFKIEFWVDMQYL